MSGKTSQLKNCIAISALLLLLTAATNTTARTIYVDDDNPADFNNIQAAINDSNDGDTIVVRDGTYTGDGNRDIDFKGKAITVRSENGPENCIINCEALGRSFYFHMGEDANSIVAGFTITNGNGPVEQCIPGYPQSVGGAIFCYSSSPTIVNCIITRNSAWYGGGIYCDSVSSPRIINNTLTRNSASSGGGIFGGQGTIQNCIINGNTAEWGGGLYGCDGTIQSNIIIGNSALDGGGGLGWCNATIRNNTICGNSSEYGGGSRGCRGTIQNCIFWGNSANETDDFPTFCCIRNWTGGGVGNIDADPCFADPNGDYHLKSQAGRWDANEGRWTKDDMTSPCIDAGDPHSPIGLEPFPNGGIINMGAYGGTAEASKSYFGEPVCETIVAGDINGDCRVDFKDFALLAYHWLEKHH
jgi:hypothetical protein